MDWKHKYHKTQRFLFYPPHLSQCSEIESNCEQSAVLLEWKWTTRSASDRTSFAVFPMGKCPSVSLKRKKLSTLDDATPKRSNFNPETKWSWIGWRINAGNKTFSLKSKVIWTSLEYSFVLSWSHLYVYTLYSNEVFSRWNCKAISMYLLGSCCSHILVGKIYFNMSDHSSLYF